MRAVVWVGNRVTEMAKIANVSFFSDLFPACVALGSGHTSGHEMVCAAIDDFAEHGGECSGDE